MIVTTFYTNDLYEEQAKRMKASAEALGLVCQVSARPHKKRDQVLRDKVDHILEAHRGNPGKDILWVDADAVIHHKPKIDPPAHCAIAAMLQHDHSVVPGTIWVRRGALGEAALMEAQILLDEHPDWETFEALSELRRRHGGRMFYGLDPAYNWVERWHRKRFPGARPVVEHFAIGTGLARAQS